MASRQRELRVVVTGDASSLKKTLGAADKDLGHFGNTGRKTLDGLKTAAVGATAALGTGLVAGLFKSVDAARESEVSQAKLEAQLKASGISYKAHADEIDNVIQKTAKLAAVDDEDLQDAFTNIVRVTGNVKKSLDLVGLATDVARAKHMDLSKAGELVGKVAGGNTGILKRYGIQIKDGATATEALGEMQKKFAGQGEKYGKTTSGAIDRAKNSVENLGESVGKALAPKIKDVADKVSTFVDQMREGTGAGGRFRDRLEEIADKIKPIVTFFKDHPALIKIAVGAWVAYRIAALAALAKIKVDTFRKAFMKSVPAAAEAGAAAGTAFDTGAAAGMTKGKGKFRGAALAIGKYMGPLIAIPIALEISDYLTKKFGHKGGTQGVIDKVTGNVQDIIRKNTPKAPAIKAPNSGIPRGVGAKASLVSSPMAGASVVREIFHDPAGIPSPGRDHYDHVHVAADGPGELQYLMGVATSRFGLTITSTSRTPSQNAAAGGSRNSYHLRGLAFDAAGAPSAMIAFAKWVKYTYMAGGGKRLTVNAQKAKKKPATMLVGSVGSSSGGLGTDASTFGTVTTSSSGLGSAYHTGGAVKDVDPEMAAAIQAMAEQLAGVRGELKRGNDLQTQIMNTEAPILKQALADAVSGSIGGAVFRGLGTPGFAGSTMTY